MDLDIGDWLEALVRHLANHHGAARRRQNSRDGAALQGARDDLARGDRTSGDFAPKRHTTDSDGGQEEWSFHRTLEPSLAVLTFPNTEHENNRHQD